MDFDTAVSLCKGRLSNFQSTLIDQTIKDEMNAAQFRLEQEPLDPMPWFLLTESATIQNVAEEPRIALPSDFILEWEEGALEWKLTTAAASAYKVVGKEDYDYLKKTYTDATGTPEGYSLAGLYFLIVPAPAAIYDWRMRYYAHQAINVNGTDENLWLKHAGEWLIAETGHFIAEAYLNNKNAMAFFDKQRIRQRDHIANLTLAMLEANRERMMGE